MSNVYEKCPILENEKFLLRFINEEDAKDLLKVYSDKKAVPYFNSDNCNNDFYVDNYDNMKQVLKYWGMEYDNCGFVRFSIVDKMQNEVIGTIELFNRKAEDYFNNCGILRLDLRSDYENKDSIYNILTLIEPHAYELFGCVSVATKAKDFAHDRIEALKRYGFIKSNEILIGHDKTQYKDYWIIYNK